MVHCNISVLKTGSILNEAPWGKPRGFYVPIKLRNFSMSMNFPQGHIPRFSNFTIDGVLDETLREGSERCMFSIDTENKIPLIRNILRTGVKDIIFGSGPDDPSDIASVLTHLQSENLIDNQKLSFILLLNCFEPLMPQFEGFPENLRRYVTISFGMISHESEYELFERTVERFRRIGFENFRVSLLNNFSKEIDEQTYQDITYQIDRSRNLGIETIRINDSLGTIYPEAMAVLAANLRHDYSKTNFCLHAHNDRGLGLQNAITSIYHGFNMIEGGFAEFGNRSGLPAIELIHQIFDEKNISISTGPLNQEALFETAHLAEETFLVAPSLFRPISGKITDCENMGVTNIPDYLGSSSASRYFLNRIGLHLPTLERIFRDLGVRDEMTVLQFRDHLKEIMQETTERKVFEYNSLQQLIEKFYDDDVLFSEQVHEIAHKFLNMKQHSQNAA